MCGIVGIVEISDKNDVINEMIDTLAHRGPDDQGAWLSTSRRVVLGHTRLSIIDLSPSGHQPMSYACGRYWITFNGEVYNYRELRQQLEQCGHSFLSATDTEVILAAYAQWGPDCVLRLRGMFAFAIWDELEQTLFLARDRFGIKPLLYAQVGQVFLFASELKALLASGLIERRIDLQAVWDYLSLGSVLQPRTILAKVKALLPGHTMLVRGQDITIQRYWDIADATCEGRKQLTSLAYGDAVAEVRRLLEDATRHHLIADVPVGAFLSGGIDSSAVVGLMSRLVHHRIKTYAVGFEPRFEQISELAWAKAAAEHFGTDHTEIVVTAREVAESFDQFITAIDQPSIDGSNTFFVSQAARQGVTVALSGLGGDELFAGYPQFRRYARSSVLTPSGRSNLRSPVALVGRVLPGRWRLPLEALVASPVERLAMVRRLMDEAEKHRALHPDLMQSFQPLDLGEHYQRLMRPDFTPIAQVSYVELRGYMCNTLLRDNDVLSMAHALEVRPVLLDHVLAEFVFALPDRFKLEQEKTKRVFRDAISDLLPPNTLTRNKVGFEFPSTGWLRTTLNERALAAFSSDPAHRLLAPKFRESCMVQLRRSGRVDSRVWAYFVLLCYLEKHGLEIAA